MDRLRMLGSLLLVRREMGTRTQIGPVVIEISKPDATGFCELISAGPEVEDLKPGQLLVMDKNGGTEVRVNGKTLVVFRHDQVLAVADAA